MNMKNSAEKPEESGRYLVIAKKKDGKASFFGIRDYDASTQIWHLAGVKSEVLFWTDLPPVPEGLKYPLERAHYITPDVSMSKQ